MSPARAVVISPFDRVVFPEERFLGEVISAIRAAGIAAAILARDAENEAKVV
ncbi:MAG: hypothetical protein HY348_02230 [Nitrospira defluvii]|nr:hypothetical protein [Nitrospira defluvii]